MINWNEQRFRLEFCADTAGAHFKLLQQKAFFILIAEFQINFGIMNYL
jgi:hypothetical protein